MLESEARQPAREFPHAGRFNTLAHRVSHIAGMDDERHGRVHILTSDVKTPAGPRRPVAVVPVGLLRLE